MTDVRNKRKCRKRAATTRKAYRAKRMSFADSHTPDLNQEFRNLECGFSALLTARDAKLVTLVADQMELAVHRSVLVAKSPVFATMVANNTAEDGSAQIVITDIEPLVLQQLVLFMYKGSAPELCSMATELLVAADKYGVLDLKAKCELQLALHLTVQNLVANAFLAMRHSCPRLKEIVRCFFQSNPTKVMGTDGWAQAVRNNPEEFIELSHFLSWCPAKSRDEFEDVTDKKLLEAVVNYKLEEVRKILATGGCIGARDFCGRTVLHYATNPTLTNYLLVAGALVNARDKCHRTPLHAAVQRRSVNMATCLIKASGNVNAADVFGNTPLHLAAELDCNAMVKKLLEEGADKSAKNSFLETPLDVAKRCNQKRFYAKLSVTDSANVPANGEGPEGILPPCGLGCLLRAGDASSSLITLVAGDTRLSVHRSVLIARSPVFAAMLAHDTVEASSGQIVISDVDPKVLEQLVLFMYKERTPEFYNVARQLLVAADKYCMPDLKAQCEQQLISDLSVENVMDNFLLAVRHSCPQLKKTVKPYLLANLTRVMDSAGWAKAVTKKPREFLEVCRILATEAIVARTGPQAALDKKLLKDTEAFSDAVKNLLSLGAYVGARDASGRTVLHTSCVPNGSIKLKLLLAAGADLGARDSDGRTPLHYAAATGREEETKCLLQAGACVDATDRWLQTPLHAAILKGNLGAVLQLLAVPADMNARDVYGNTPLDLAARLGNESVFLALLNAGAHEHTKQNMKETLLDLVKRCNMYRLLDMVSTMSQIPREGSSQALPAEPHQGEEHIEDDESTDD